MKEHVQVENKRKCVTVLPKPFMTSKTNIFGFLNFAELLKKTDNGNCYQGNGDI